MLGFPLLRVLWSDNDTEIYTRMWDPEDAMKNGLPYPSSMLKVVYRSPALEQEERSRKAEAEDAAAQERVRGKQRAVQGDL